MTQEETRSRERIGNTGSIETDGMKEGVKFDG